MSKDYLRDPDAPDHRAADVLTRRAALGLLALGALSACAAPAAAKPAAALPPNVAAAAPNGVAAAAPPAAPAIVSETETAVRSSATVTVATADAAAAATSTVASVATTASQATRALTSATSATTAGSAVTAAQAITQSRTATAASAAAIPAPPPVTVALPPRASLGPLIFISQTLNNCGPASIAETLRYWGIVKTQGEVQAILRADGNPRGMEPWGVPSYMQALGMGVVMGVEGTATVVKALVAKGYPVIVNQWVSLTDHTGHFRPIEAYDDARGGFIASDPYLGPGHFITYADFDAIWVTNHGRFMVLHPPARQVAVQAILTSAGWDKTIAYQTDLAQQAEHHFPPSFSPTGRFADFGRSFGALNQAFDQIQLGQFAAARAALTRAQAANANPVLVRWIADLLPAS